MSDEQRPIKDFPGYFVTRDGRIFGPRGQLSQHIQHGSGIIVADLYRDGKRWRKRSHRLVAETWIPNPEGFPAVLRRDGDLKNNRADNLYWGHTRTQKLSWEIVRAVRSPEMSKVSTSELARRYGVTRTTMRRVRSGHGWKE